MNQRAERTNTERLADLNERYAALNRESTLANKAWKRLAAEIRNLQEMREETIGDESLALIDKEIEAVKREAEALRFKCMEQADQTRALDQIAETILPGWQPMKVPDWRR